MTRLSIFGIQLIAKVASTLVASRVVDTLAIKSVAWSANQTLIDICIERKYEKSSEKCSYSKFKVMENL